MTTLSKAKSGKSVLSSLSAGVMGKKGNPADE